MKKTRYENVEQTVGSLDLEDKDLASVFGGAVSRDIFVDGGTAEGEFTCCPEIEGCG